MKLEHLEMLDAIVQSGSFAKAAQERLLISQPAVSAAIRRLEDELGFELFDRSTYRPSLTEKGQAFYARARQLLSEAASLTRYADGLAAGTEAELRIAFDPYSLHPALLCVFKTQTESFVDTRFVFLHAHVGGALVRLMDGETDLALMPWLAASYDGLPLVRKHLFTFELSPMAASDHPLVHLQAERPLLPADLRSAVQVVQRSEDRYLPSGGFGLQPSAHHWQVHDMGTKQMLIEAGLGFGALAHHVVAAQLACGSLVCLTGLPDYRVVKQPVYLVRHADRPLGPVAQALWDALKAFPVDALHAIQAAR
ncbi:MAG: LysR family transcriptional regulator [Candidatus Sericytochromatia bacterium]